MKIRLTRIDVGLWKHGEYSVRRSDITNGYGRYIVMGPGVRDRSYRGVDIRTLSEAREIIADAIHDCRDSE